ncbi:hypothetical protein M433DRAFT_148660 [Acidomyces richmondensis BFW]|nr:MAG: hypothetical protein FE78DRAFT_87087 [Acidomyces sp. 'richmondensis']KYG50716.1 hypothetical protein M433DRAFT_148660 [Acidomyces richmondensis BFW]
MRTSVYAFVAAFASAAFSLSIPGLPPCAQNCVTSFGSCNQLDVKCICSDTSLIANLACCVGKVCDAADQNATITFADSLCAGQGVSDLPKAATCAPGATAGTLASASATASSSATSGMTSTGTMSSTTTTTGSSASAASSSALSSASSSVSSALSAASSSASSAAASSSSSAAAAMPVNVPWMGSTGLGLVFAGIAAAL